MTDDYAIQALNRDYRHIDKPTDVLSFAQDFQHSLLGDIVISVETAKTQAAKAGWPFENELTLLAVHGMLHLLGHDDESDDGANTMEMLTRRILQLASITLPAGCHPFFTQEIITPT